MAKEIQNILITGASTGIGLALVQLLKSKKEYRIIATARESSLGRFEKEGLSPSDHLILRALDVCNYDQASELVEEINSKWGGVDILINNAGISYRAVVEHMNPSQEMQQLNVNYFGPLHLIRKVLPSMRKKKRGRIINVSSVGGMMAMPTMSSYSASKFALEGASESLWYELKPWNIEVTLVQPGFIRSSGFQHVISTKISECSMNTSMDPYHQHYEHMNNFIEKLMTHTIHTSESVAQTIYKVMKQKHPPLRVSGTWNAMFFSYLRRLLPRRIYHWFLYKNLPHVKNWGQIK